jgi:hypothetical protein
MRDLAPGRHWWNADEGCVHRAVFEHVQAVEQNQFDQFDRFEKLACLYDPNANTTTLHTGGAESFGAYAQENVIASNVDTVTAAIAATEVRARYMTDDADWSTWRTARELEYYSEELDELLEVHPKARLAFKEAATKGTGLVKVYADAFRQVRVEAIRCDDVVVDEVQCRNGAKVKHLHQRMTNVDREELAAAFPECEPEIMRAQTGTGNWRAWAGYRPLDGDNLVVIESWRLPIGVKDSKGYKPGRHTITIDGCDLLDEPYHKPHFPIARIVWSERTNGWYGISLAERIAGIQRALNKRNWQIDRNLDQVAVPTTFVRPIDANMTTKSTRAGGLTTYKGEEPKTVFPQAVSAETYQNRNDMKAAAYEESGVSRLAAQSVKPSGLDSGVAMREYRDQTTQRFAMQEKAFEQLVLDIIWLILDVCKDLGDAAPEVVRKSRFGARKIRWADVDMRDVKVQIAASSALPRTPAGRYQTALEWAQAGVITTDEWRRLTEHPDLDRVLSLYTEGIDCVEHDLEMIERGEYVVPEPYGNHQLMVRMGMAAYQRDRKLANCPEEVLEALRQYTDLAAYYLSGGDAANQNAAPPMPGDELGMDAAMPMDPAMAAQPVAALADNAMNLRAS